MIAWRIAKPAYARADRALSGAGAQETGGRWNEAGLPVVYGSQTSSLALLETLVHVSLERLPDDLMAIPIAIPSDATVSHVALKDLHADWQDVRSKRCAQIGSNWLRAKSSLVLVVPSATNPLESNILLNPAHHDIKRCKIGATAHIRFDPRFNTLVQLKRP